MDNNSIEIKRKKKKEKEQKRREDSEKYIKKRRERRKTVDFQWKAPLTWKYEGVNNSKICREEFLVDDSFL